MGPSIKVPSSSFRDLKAAENKSQTKSNKHQIKTSIQAKPIIFTIPTWWGQLSKSLLHLLKAVGKISQTKCNQSDNNYKY